MGFCDVHFLVRRALASIAINGYGELENTTHKNPPIYLGQCTEVYT